MASLTPSQAGGVLSQAETAPAAARSLAAPISGSRSPPLFVTNADFDRGINKLAAEGALAVDIDGYLVVADRDRDIDQGRALSTPASEPAMPSS
jgi:hypothetical protein